MADGTDVFDVDAALRKLVSRGGSDLHLKANSPPLYRVYATFGPADGESPLSPEDTEEAMRAVMSDPAKQKEFERENEADFSFEIDGVSRFRVNAFRQRGLVSLALRAIPNEIRSIDDLQLPPVVGELAEEERGIILLTGTTGSGKSTTLAAMIDHINETMTKHIVTIEDPIEYVHPDKRSAINQREVGMDTASFGRAMRRVLRQDPDVILIGEMRDEETVRAALSAAETGHLVLSTVHTLDASESINRILDFFPPHQHSQARAMIAGTLKGVISQRLVQSVDGKRVAVCEVLRMTGRVRDMIKDPEQMGKLGDVIFTGGYYGMQTFDQALFKHVKAGRVTFEDAMRVATSPHDFKLLLEADGKRGTTMDDVAEAHGKRSPDAPDATPAPATSGGASAGSGTGAGVSPGAGTAAPAAASAGAASTPNGAPNGAPNGGVSPGAGVTPGAAAATPAAGAVSPGAASATPAAAATAGAQQATDPGNVSAAVGNGAPSGAGATPGVSNGAPPTGNGAPPAAPGTAGAGGGLSAGASPASTPSATPASAAPQTPAATPATPPAAPQTSAAPQPSTATPPPAGGLSPGAGVAQPPAAPTTGNGVAAEGASIAPEASNGESAAPNGAEDPAQKDGDGGLSPGAAPAPGGLTPGAGS